MTIDPFKMPCPFCQSTLFLQDVSMEDEKLINCESCGVIVSPELFISSGINALAGKLARLEEVKFFQKDYEFHRVWDWGYSWDDNHEYGNLPRHFNSFEEAVLDAYECLKGRKNDY